MTITPICVPEEWDDNGSILFEEFCALIRTPQRTVRERRRCGRGPTWQRQRQRQRRRHRRGVATLPEGRPVICLLCDAPASRSLATSTG